MTLSGARSTAGTDEALISYSWRQLSGPLGTLTEPEGMVASFIAAEAGLGVFELVVSDGEHQSPPAVVKIAFESGTQELPKSVLTDQRLALGPNETVVLDGSASTGGEEDELVHLWHQTVGPVTQIKNTPQRGRVEIAPVLPGFYRFTLTAKNNAGVGLPTHVDLLVTDDSHHVPELSEAAADSGEAYEPVVLSALGEEGADEALELRWVQTDGPSVVLDNPTQASPEFVPTQSGAYAFDVHPDNGTYMGPPQSISFEVAPSSDEPPTAVAGEDFTAALGNEVALNGEASSDPEGSALTYAWAQTYGPEGVELVNPDSARPSFLPTSSAAFTGSNWWSTMGGWILSLTKFPSPLGTTVPTGNLFGCRRSPFWTGG